MTRSAWEWPAERSDFASFFAGGQPSTLKVTSRVFIGPSLQGRAADRSYAVRHVRKTLSPVTNTFCCHRASWTLVIMREGRRR